LISHDELLDALWPETYVQPQVLRTYMLELRKVLCDDPGQPRFIQTLPKRGYCFVAPVTDCSNANSAESPVKTAGEIRAAAIVGREAELALLGAQIDALATGRRVLFVTGEAGIGKTSLVEAFCSQLKAAGAARIANGQCVEGFAAKEEYYPVMEALGQLCATDQEACRVLTQLAPAWIAALKRAPEDAQNRLLERMPGDLCAALEAMAAERPLVLILEDLNWADDSTLHLISALARRRAPAQLLVIVTYRAGGTPPEHPLRGLKQDLLMRRLCIEIALQPLAKPAVRELLSRELKQANLPPGLSSFVHEHSEGNPLFAIAILEHIIAQGFLIREQKDGVAEWTQRAPFQEMEAGVPDGLAQMIELEISRLTPQEQRMLEAGSLISVAFPSWAVAAALQEDAAETEEACDALARRLHFLARAGLDELPDGTRSSFYAFAHGLYREVLYQRQAATRRARRHGRIADRLSEMFVGREASVAREMALHYESAGNWQRAVQSLRDAAHHAKQRQAHAEAAELLEHALRMAENLHEAECENTAEVIRHELTAAREALNGSTDRRC
jgi:predicted ATPase